MDVVFTDDEKHSGTKLRYGFKHQRLTLFGFALVRLVQEKRSNFLDRNLWTAHFLLLRLPFSIQTSRMPVQRNASGDYGWIYTTGPDAEF